jgi:hypothetical protein
MGFPAITLPIHLTSTGPSTTLSAYSKSTLHRPVQVPHSVPTVTAPYTDWSKYHTQCLQKQYLTQTGPSTTFCAYSNSTLHRPVQVPHSVPTVMVFRSHDKSQRINAVGDIKTPSFRLDISLWRPFNLLLSH